ncbi:CU044_2847 family protein [Amycolatopsis sp. NPDC005232]|uniref:CU044_2847 family protein n=1 Tax=Amycolatopsis sp. NPDC005232 TaxID=3157027 RepID=UPI00339F2B75
MDDYAEPARREYVPVEVDGRPMYAEVELVGDQEEEVASRLLSFGDFTENLGTLTRSVTEAVTAGLTKVKPTKVTIEFGCEVGLESGKLTAILVKGTAKANLKVTMEWQPGADG